jgi:hypothetical protein
LPKLTVPEVFMILEDPKKRGSSGQLNMTNEEIYDEALRYHALTPLERLDEKLQNMKAV